MQTKQIQDTVRISLRKCKTKEKECTAGELKSGEGYRVFQKN